MTDTLELIDLNLLTQDEDSLQCEADHSAEYNPCSVEVVYMGIDCELSLFLCKNSVDGTGGIRHQMKYAICDKCGREASECWEVRPI